MKKIFFLLNIFIFPLLLFSCGGSENSNFSQINGEKPNTSKQYIIIKADDLRYVGKENIIDPNWKKFIAFVILKDIKASIGIITQSLSHNREKYYSLLKAINGTGKFEFWIHGYNHIKFQDRRKEFCGTDYKYQKEHIQGSIKLGKEKLGITFHTFGAPFNCIDDNTLQVIDETEEIKVWLYGDKRSSKFVIPKTEPKIEKSKIVDGKWDVDVNYEEFIIYYDPSTSYYIFQIHPKKWDDKDWKNFEVVIDFLKKQNVEFVTPYEFYLIKTNQSSN